MHVARQGVRGLFETRAVRTPQGDLLLIFPQGDHYASGSGKVNEMIAYRSRDAGQTWQGPNVAFDIQANETHRSPFSLREPSAAVRMRLCAPTHSHAINSRSPRRDSPKNELAEIGLVRTAAHEEICVRGTNDSIQATATMVKVATGPIMNSW